MKLKFILTLLADGVFYVGETTRLVGRLNEHTTDTSVQKPLLSFGLDEQFGFLPLKLMKFTKKHVQIYEGILIQFLDSFERLKNKKISGLEVSGFDDIGLYLLAKILTQNLIEDSLNILFTKRKN